MGAIAIGDLIKSTLGPKGMVNGRGWGGLNIETIMNFILLRRYRYFWVVGGIIVKLVQ